MMASMVLIHRSVSAHDQHDLRIYSFYTYKFVPVTTTTSTLTGTDLLLSCQPLDFLPEKGGMPSVFTVLPDSIG